MKRPIPFGKYYLLERINVGGMAEVFKAKTYGVEGFERLLAVKRILPNIAEDEEFITMFIDEAKIAVELNHGNIAQIFDLGKVDGSFFIALEYVPGKDLRAIFDRCRSLTEPMPVAQACFIIMKVCEGLDYAHNKRDKSGREMHLVHRDVSPQNILISFEGEVKLVDFGIAKAAGKASQTQAGILKGKFGYMSPEQVRGLPLDRRSDIFSVGIVLYEMLTGERLFTGESDFSTLEKVRNVEILPPSTYNRRIGEQLEQIVLKALAKDVEDRYQNAIDLHDSLQAYLYASSEFYSRKDLAGWMKKTFAREIEEEAKKQEEYRHLPAPEVRSGPPPVPKSPARGEAAAPGGNGRSQSYADAQVAAAAAAPADVAQQPMFTADSDLAELALRGPAEEGPGLTWDEDEIETQIYDKPNPSSMSDMINLIDGPLATAPGAVVGPSASGSAAVAGVASDPAHLSPPAEGALPIKPRRTTRVPAISTVQAKQLAEVGRSRAGLWISLAVFTALLCGGVVYYYMVMSKKPGAISLAAVPGDAEVFLDGKKQPAQGMPMTIRSLKPGFYIVTLVKPGYSRWSETVEVSPGGTAKLSPRLEALATASIELRTTPRDGEALLDGRRLEGKTPMRITHLAPGPHRLEVHKPPYQPWVKEFEIQPQQVLRLYAKLLPQEVAVRISSDPRGEAFLIRDGQSESVGVTPVSLKLNPKFPYQVEVRKEGFKSWSQPIIFDGEEPVVVKAELERAGAAKPQPANIERLGQQPGAGRTASVSRTDNPPQSRLEPAQQQPAPPMPEEQPEPPRPPAPGTLLINSNPWTKITIDGRDTGLTTPQKKIPLPAGKHRITLRNDKFGINESFVVTINPGEPTKVIKTFQLAP